MRAFTQSGKLVITLAVALLCLSTAPEAVFADDGKDDKDKTSAPAKVAPAKTDPAAAGLTERERMLLDRVEQLEKRVAELEGKKDGGAPGAAAAAPGEANAVAATAPVTNAAPGNVATAASNSSTSVVKSADSGASATVAASPASAGSPASQDQTTPTNVAQVATNGKPGNVEPFSDADWTWLNGNPRTKDIYWDTKFFTPEIRVDTNYVSDFNHPTDHSIGGSSELFRSSEVQLEQLGIGGDFHYDDVRGRFMTQLGMYSATTPRNDASPGHGQWDLDAAYRYLSEAYGGYHFNVLHGVNVDAGIFLSYIGLFSYYNFDNWAYQPSYVSSNTPWFFNGVRVQVFPTEHLKIEPWFINGWQSYASANHRPGVGGQIKWTPKPWLNIISNNYGLGRDDLFLPERRRIHTDNSIEVKYYDNPEKTLDKMAFSLTGDLGCEYGEGVSCYGDRKGGPKQSFVGYMLYNRFWFHNDLFGLTVGGGQINNPGRYLVLLPPINGETAITAATNSPYFTENPGDPYKAWDSSITFDYMPKQYITFRWEYDYRHANVPYWTGRGGITPPGGNTGAPQFYVCSSGSSSGQLSLGPAETACGGGINSVWFPDLRKDESFIDLSILIKF
ncbi:MAG TPA: outer membrane beta-barrel protein [Candidatus Acidoferrum sp.]|nr:outer membrane beta-barrel protein [Candidatus Acidoferrum sp.]